VEESNVVHMTGGSGENELNEEIVEGVQDLEDGFDQGKSHVVISKKFYFHVFFTLRVMVFK